MQLSSLEQRTALLNREVVGTATIHCSKEPSSKTALRLLLIEAWTATAVLGGSGEGKAAPTSCTFPRSRTEQSRYNRTSAKSGRFVGSGGSTAPTARYLSCESNMASLFSTRARQAGYTVHVGRDTVSYSTFEGCTRHPHCDHAHSDR